MKPGVATTGKLLDKGLQDSNKGEHSNTEAKADATSTVKPKTQDVKMKEVNPQVAQNFFKQRNQ